MIVRIPCEHPGCNSSENAVFLNGFIKEKKSDASDTLQKILFAS